MQKEIIWNNKKWIIDYENGTIYQKGITPGLPVQVRIGNYRLTNLGGVCYFTTGNKFYKIDDETISEISKEEYENIKNYRTLNKKDPATMKVISNYATSIIIDDLMKRKFNLKVSIPVNNTNIINSFSKKFSYEITNQIKRLSTEIIMSLPVKVNTQTIKHQIYDIYNNIVQENEELFQVLIDNIYLNDKERFDSLSEDIINSRKKNKKQEDILNNHSIQEEQAERKRK